MKNLNFITDDDWLELKAIEKREVKRNYFLQVQRGEILTDFKNRRGMQRLLNVIFRNFDN